MKLTITYLDVRLALTVPKKWRAGPVRRLLAEYLGSPTARKLGLGPGSDVGLEIDGASVALDAAVGAAIRDGCVVRVVDRRERAAAGDGHGARVISRYGTAKHLAERGTDTDRALQREARERGGWKRRLRTRRSRAERIGRRPRSGRDAGP